MSQTSVFFIKRVADQQSPNITPLRGYIVSFWLTFRVIQALFGRHLVGML